MNAGTRDHMAAIAGSWVDRFPQLHFIALTSFLDEKLIQQALQAGAVSYLLKSVSADKLAETVRSAARGEATPDASAARLLVRAATQQPLLGHDLTARERQVLALMVEGHTNRDIAKILNLSHGTIRVYVSKILIKLNASNRTEAVVLSLQHGILEGPLE